MNFASKPKELNIALSAALKRIIAHRNETRTETAAICGIHPSVLSGQISKNAEGIKPESLIKTLYKLGATITIHVRCEGRPELDTRIYYTGHADSIRHELPQIGRRYLAANNLGLTEAARLCDAQMSTVNRVFTSSKENSALHTSAQLFSKLGIQTFIGVRHGTVRVTDLFEAPPASIPFSSKLDNAKEKKAIGSKPVPSYIEMLSDRMVSDMMRGQVKTSMGEVIRPFL